MDLIVSPGSGSHYSAAGSALRWHRWAVVAVRDGMRALRAATVNAVDRYWAAWLGCTPGSLRPAMTAVIEHGPGLADYDGTFVLLAGGAPVISLPRARLGALEARARHWCGEQVRAPGELARAHEPHVEVARVVGPAWVGYADAGTLIAPPAMPTPGSRSRLLTSADAPMLAELRRACDAEEWEHGGHALEDGTAAGAFVDERLVALAGYTRWGDRLAHLSVVTHPAWRGHGFGRAAVAHVAAHALDRGLVAQYRTLEANAASRGLGTALGFLPLLTTVAARYRSAPRGRLKDVAE